MFGYKKLGKKIEELEERISALEQEGSMLPQNIEGFVSFFQPHPRVSLKTVVFEILSHLGLLVTYKAGRSGEFSLTSASPKKEKK